jgi:hypothetical protein
MQAKTLTLREMKKLTVSEVIKKLAPAAKAERQIRKLTQCDAYNQAFEHYVDGYNVRPPYGIPDRNMLKALRMLTWRNSAEDWARLHVCEVFLRRRRN